MAPTDHPAGIHPRDPSPTCITRGHDRVCFDPPPSTTAPGTGAPARYTLAVAIAQARADLRAMFRRDRSARRARTITLATADQATDADAAGLTSEAGL